MEGTADRSFFVAGNKPLLERLHRDLREGQLNHAYILDGPPGSGRHTVARWLCAAIACQNRPGRRIVAEDADQLDMFGTPALVPPPPPDAPLPCGVCEDCRRVAAETCPDICLIGRGGKATVGVDSVRFLRQDVLNPPNRLDTKIYIIEDADTMTVQAQNSLLLTLEEPPSYVLFLLLCNGADNLLETIRSRAPVLRLSPVEDRDIRDALVRHGRSLSSDDMAALLLQADGLIGRALALSDERTLAAILRDRTRCTQLLEALAAGQTAAVMAAVYGWDSKRDAVADTLAELRLATRDLLLLKRSDAVRPLFFTDQEAATALSDRFTVRRLMRLWNAVGQAQETLEGNGNLRLTLTRMVHEITRS